jgi:hypothetical protein
MTALVEEIAETNLSSGVHLFYNLIYTYVDDGYLP